MWFYFGHCLLSTYRGLRCKCDYKRRGERVGQLHATDASVQYPDTVYLKYTEDICGDTFCCFQFYLKYKEDICGDTLCCFQFYEPKDPGVLKIVDSYTLIESEAFDFNVGMLSY